MNTKIKEMIKEIGKDLRAIIRLKRESAKEGFYVVVNDKDMNKIMVELMSYAQWIRVDLELLIRASFWLTLSIDELSSIVIDDQEDLLKKIIKRTGTQDPVMNALFVEIQNKKIAISNHTPKVENNAEILKHEIWHRDKLINLYNYFYAIITKFTHPDPFFTFFPETEEHRKQIVINARSIFDRCAIEIDKEWSNLEGELGKS